MKGSSESAGPKETQVPVAIGKGRHALPLIYQANLRKKAPSSQFAMHSIFSRTKSNNAANYGSTDDFGRVVSHLEPAQYSDGFLPFTTDRPVDVGDAAYGYMSYERHIVLHPEQVSVLVDTVSAELGARGGITAPFIFSSSALDTSSSGVKRLIRTFLDAQISRTPAADHSWREEAKFASPHNLAMLMRWALARIIRVVDGREERGLVPWEHYTAFRDSEVAANFPPQHFSTFLPSLLPPVRHTVLTVLSVLARLTANSTSSGHTPPTLSPLFGGLFFGLGVQGAPFHHTYVYYLRATNAMEHIILSFIRFQDTAKLGVPTRLKEWIKGYPVMLASQSSRPEPRKGARTVRLVSVRRNVRMYSRDLIRSASTWESELLRSPVRYSDTYRKRMDMPPSFEPEAVGSTMTPGAADQRFRSLTDFKWGEFEELGFGGLGGDDKKLQFDLTESARSQRNVKRQTLSWNDFSSSGFTRTDIAPLMQFTPSPTSPNSTASEIIHGKKLKKSAKLPVFQWDTTPVVGQEEVVEEAFLDVFCDVLCSWPNTEPEEERECNWAMIEFSPSTLLLFEEFVPLEYRQQLISGPSNGRKRLPSLFSSSSPGSPSTKSMNKKSSKKNLAVASSAASVGSRISRNAAAEVEFEGLLRGDGGRKTKVIRLGGTPEIVTSPAPSFPLSKTISPASSSKPQSTPITPSKSSSSTDSRRRFRINTPLSTPRKSIISGIPSEATTVDFETRLASLDSDAYEEYPVVGGISQQQDDDSWVDILVGSQERRMANQQFVVNGKRGAGARGYGGDPDLVSMDVEEAMKGVPRDMSASPEVAEIAPPPRTVFQSIQDDGYGEEDESVEIETVPRRPQSSHSSHTEKSYRRDEIDLGTDDEEDRESQRPKKLGYFDLHPERRPPPSLTSQHDDNDDPRERFHADSDSEDDEVVIRDVTVRALPTVPAIVTPITTPPTGETKSKTASLIEMYREKEKGTTSPVAPSKIPILAAAAASSSPAKSPSPALAPPEVIPPTIVAIEEGRASPARYVHGAPLHNVLEEEEEE